jgi:D-glycero-D-manno-heptose 1,7-bisphosphate phosphatase
MEELVRSFLINDTCWMRLFHTPAVIRPALFLDRDGVMIEEKEYLSNPDEVNLIPGCVQIIQCARAEGFLIIVVTNQSGIGRGYFNWQDYLRVENKLIDLLKFEGTYVDAIFANSATSSHRWRKPRPGMLLAAANALEVDLNASLIIGDKASDLEAGRRAGLRQGFHVLTGHGSTEVDKVYKLADAHFEVKCLRSIFDLVAEFKLCSD